MNTPQRLALFDVDGTIAEHGIFPRSIIEGIHHLRQVGYITTISTGRGYIRAKEALGDHFNTLISEDALIIVEHGSKIVDKSGQIVSAKYFNQAEIDHVVDFTRANIDLFRLAWFNPVDPDRKVQVWCHSEDELNQEIEKRGHYADVFFDSISG
jgi:hydroxymethylpyrimidine pyrophosphatase-like HAD family hydrolase